VSPDLLHSVPGTFRYVECAVCQTVYQNPRVREEDLPLCYPADYFTHAGELVWEGHPATRGSLRDLVKRAVRHAADAVPEPGLRAPVRFLGRVLALHPGLRRRARLGLVDGLAPPPGAKRRCLEVGPGFGLDLWRLSQLGWEAFGLDVDPVAAGNARARSGCEVRVGTLASTDYPAGHFDLVYMSHVFEHLSDPVRAAERCLELLAPGGRLVLVYPNPAALTARIHGRFSCVFEPPRHLVLPSGVAVSNLLGRAGYVAVRAASTARSAATYHAASRGLRAGLAWDWTRPRPPAPRDRVLGLLEAVAAVFVPVGEEIVVDARKPGATG